MADGSVAGGSVAGGSVTGRSMAGGSVSIRGARQPGSADDQRHVHWSYCACTRRASTVGGSSTVGSSPRTHASWTTRLVKAPFTWPARRLRRTTHAASRAKAVALELAARVAAGGWHFGGGRFFAGRPAP